MQKFTPTHTQIRLAEAVLTTMAHEAVIRPIVEGYQKAILAKHQFSIASLWVEHGCKDQLILEPKDSYLLSEQDAKCFFAECNEAREAANLAVDSPEYCPLLVAENLRVQAENALVEAIATRPGLESQASGAMSLEERKQVIDLILKLLAPYCGNAQEILQRYCVAEGSNFNLPGVWEEVEPNLYVRTYNDGQAFIEAKTGSDSIRFVGKVAGHYGDLIAAVQQVGQTQASQSDPAAIVKAIEVVEAALTAAMAQAN